MQRKRSYSIILYYYHYRLYKTHFTNPNRLYKILKKLTKDQPMAISKFHGNFHGNISKLSREEMEELLSTSKVGRLGLSLSESSPSKIEPFIPSTLIDKPEVNSFNPGTFSPILFSIFLTAFSKSPPR